MPTTDHIADLEHRLANARDDDRLDAQLALALAITGNDPHRAHDLARDAVAFARTALDTIQKKGAKPSLVVERSDAQAQLAKGLYVLGRCNRLLSNFSTALILLQE